MKTFSEVRNSKVKGDLVYNKKHKRITTQVYKTRKGYSAYVDGDLLDNFRSEKDAVKSIETAIKELT
jgi:hypothetical protein